MWCFHDRRREFTFSDGQQIKCCPDCTRFDNQRAEVLRVSKSEVLVTELKLHWREMLDEAGLNEHVGEVSWLSYVGTTRDLTQMQMKRGSFKLHESLLEESAKWDSWAEVLVKLKSLYDQRRIDAKKTYNMLDDHEHIERTKPLPHVLTMPRAFRTFCVHCVDVVLSNKKPFVIRMTKGVYLPIDHDCNSVRIYDLKGNLIEVKPL